MHNRRDVLAGVGAVAALAAAPKAGQAQPAKVKTLKAVVHADVKILDPVWTTAYITQRHATSSTTRCMR